MATKLHPHDRHDWHSAEYVRSWAQGQDLNEKDRQQAFRSLADEIPYKKAAPIKILDLGAGYGALTQFLLERFPHATAICQDGSEEMAKLGKQRMSRLKGRVDYVFCDFARPRWHQAIKAISGSFEAVVSSLAIHNVREPKIIQRIYKDIFPLVKPGGCFLNFDMPRPSLEEHLKWLRGAGLEDVKIFWQGDNRAVFGGFRRLGIAARTTRSLRRPGQSNGNGVERARKYLDR
jgi:SAM-dependent methyltransferase